MPSPSITKNESKILAIIPCYNEAASIELLLREFAALDFPVDTLVIDDGSSDGTYEIASQFSKALRLEKNQGVPIAIKLGISHALENGYDYCVQIDGDGQHVPSAIALLLNGLKTSSANMTIGSRYYGRSISLQGGIRRLAGLLISLQICALFGRCLFDPLSGMRMMDKVTMRYFIQQMNAASLDAEIVPLTLRKNLIIIEVPVNMRPRMTGKSYVGGLKGVVFMLRLMGAILKIRFEVYR